MSVVDVVVVLVFIAFAVVGAEVVRRTCRRQLTSGPAHKPDATVTPAPASAIGTAEVD
jgi:uncharacterized protein YneF (UPF0154 family)